jgi:hypothetical protein
MNILKGWKTRALSGAVTVLGIAELFNPDLIADALGVGQQGRAITIIAVGVLIFILRQITDTPAGKPE